MLRWSTDAEREQVFNALSEKGKKEFLNVLAKQPTLGYVWTSESAGYSVRYANQTVAPDGGDRVIVATDKPLGSWNPQIWKATGTSSANGYEFTVIELRLNRRRGTGGGQVVALRQGNGRQDRKNNNRRELSWRYSPASHGTCLVTLRPSVEWDGGIEVQVKV